MTLPTMSARRTPERPPPPPRRRRRRRPWLRVSALLLAVLLFMTGWSVATALAAPGQASVVARLAEWARDHHLSSVVTLAERVQYKLHPPKTGGLPAGGLPRAAAPLRTPAQPAGLKRTPLPAAVSPFAQPALAGEGQWQVLEAVRGQPAVLGTFLRPDPVHTSYVTGVAWIDPRLARFELHPGMSQPGGRNWQLPPYIPVGSRKGLLATFNSGFKMADARGGFYADGRAAVPLRMGAASFVIYRNGTATVGAWGVDVGHASTVVAVRQNLDLIVENGAPVAGLDQNVQGRWGATLGNNLYVWRSGVGVTATGAIVYVAGNALSAVTLAKVLVAAGAVRAMELDINPYWTTFSYYRPAAVPGGVVPVKLTADQQRIAGRFLAPVNRDFFAVYAR